MAKPVTFSRPADRCDALRVIALVLRAGALADPFEDYAAWVAGVEVIEGLKRAGFTVVRNTPPSPVIHHTNGIREAVRHCQLIGQRSRWRAARSACSWLRRSGDAGDLGPNLKGLGPGSSILGGGHSVTAEVEKVVDPVVGGKEALCLAN